VNQVINAIILGIIQGVTEWFPVSSTGHLKLAEHLFGFHVPLLFDVTLHVGTLIVVLFYFRHPLKKILVALVRLDFETEYGRLIPLIIVGTIPTVLFGVILGDAVTDVFQHLVPIGIAFLISGLIQYSVKRGFEKTDRVDFVHALLIGTAQGFAIIPGISRSGATIATALVLGVTHKTAFLFSFLLSIPTILGAVGFTLFKEFPLLAVAGLGWIEIGTGVVVAMVVGYGSLKILQKILVTKNFHVFAVYCWLLGLISICLGLGVEPFRFGS
jgi:undecaprenyl-diphosphatase